MYKRLFFVDKEKTVLKIKIAETDTIINDTQTKEMIIADYVMEQQVLCLIADGCQCMIGCIRTIPKHVIASYIEQKSCGFLISFPATKNNAVANAMTQLLPKWTNKFWIKQRGGCNIITESVLEICTVEDPNMTRILLTDEHINDIVRDIVDLQVQTKKKITDTQMTINTMVTDHKEDINNLIQCKKSYHDKLADLEKEYEQLKLSINEESTDILITL